MTLGNVGKASYTEFAGKRKLLIISYVTATRDDPELHKMLMQYWTDTLTQVRKLEVGLGGVQHLFHEGSVGEGPEAVEVLEQGNPHGYPHLKRMIEAGAALEPTEDLECLKETLDLHRCMSVVQASRPVLERLLTWFDDARKRRFAAIAERVGEHLAENGVGVLVISPDHEISFAENIEVIYVVPPILDRINRWLRERPLEGPVEEDDGESSEPSQDDDETPRRAL